MKRGGLLLWGILLPCALWAQSKDSCHHVVWGHVYDAETKEPLPYANVEIKGLGLGKTTDENGYFEIDTGCEHEVNFEISYLGYKSVTHHHDEYHEQPAIYLAHEDVLLESVVVEGQIESYMNSAASETISLDDLQSKSAKSFGDIASDIGGITSISTGQNVVKPVIHGLHSNRILIINDGVRHEFQNWGVEHAPEIDPSQIKDLEVVKGAATVRYGPDALGGVLLIHPNPLELTSSLKGSVMVSGNSNGRAGHTEAVLSRGLEHWAFSGQASMTKQGDLSAPNYNLTNTGKEEYGYSMATRWHKGVWDLESRYSRFNQKLGILRGSVNGNLEDLQLAINSEPTPETRPFSYDINQPYQWVDHQIVMLRGSVRLSGHLLKMRYAYQDNHRQEYDLRKGTTKPTPNIDLSLKSNSLDMDWIHPQYGIMSGQLGVQLQYQNNDNIPGTRTAQFIPNYDYQRAGVFVVESWGFEQLTLEAGLRYDYQYTSISGVYQSKRYNQELDYHNLTASVGFVKQLNNQSNWRVNIGSAWRPPNMAELYSFGRHQSAYDYGFWTFTINEFNEPETATAALTNMDKKVYSELGYKLITEWEVIKPNWQLSLSGYVNYISNYIYTKPAGITQTARGAFPYFIYDQDNAVLTGLDGQMKKKYGEKWESTGSFYFLYARNLSQKEYFVGMPPIELKFKHAYQPDWSFADFTELYLTGKYVFSQWMAPRVITIDQIFGAQENGENLFAENDKIFDLVDVPNRYFLMDIGVQMHFGDLETALQVQNVLNTSYRSYTDRMRYYADEVGRNFSLSLRWKFN